MKSKPLDKNGDSSSLIVFVHGYTDRARKYDAILGEVKAAHPNADILQPLYWTGFLHGLFHNEDPFDIASEIETLIDEAYTKSLERRKPYRKIILIGYSMGALLVRKAYVYGRGSEEDRPGSPDFTPPNEWTNQVERIILLAGLNRGWSFEERPSSMSPVLYVSTRYLLLPLARALPAGRILKAIERGSPFVANLRVQWIRLIQKNRNRVAPVVQLLGSVDNLVDEEDDADLYIHEDFIFIPVVGAYHASLMRFDKTDLGRRCRNRFVEALTMPIRDLKKKYDDEPHTPHKKIDKGEKHIVFVMHGIRDTGGWTGNLGWEIKKTAMALPAPTPEVVVVTPKYAYFPLARFFMSRFLRTVRVANVNTFMDDYTEYLAAFPNRKNKISFIGHSNGTYILASALEKYKTLRIYRASFAGSVVPRRYDWNRIITREGRLEALRNDIAVSDLVVGLFPKTFEQWNYSDVGSGGFDGFLHNSANMSEQDYYIGGHGAAIRSANFPSIANFILTGEIKRDPNLTRKGRPWWLNTLSQASILAWIGLFAGLLYLFKVSYDSYGLIGAVLYIFLVYLVINFL